MVKKTWQCLTYLMTDDVFARGWSGHWMRRRRKHPPPSSASLQGKWGDDDGGGRFLFCIVAEKGRKLNRSALGFLPRQAGGSAHIRRHPEDEHSGRKTVFFLFFLPTRLSCPFLV